MPPLSLPPDPVRSKCLCQYRQLVGVGIRQECGGTYRQQSSLEGHDALHERKMRAMNEVTSLVLVHSLLVGCGVPSWLLLLLLMVVVVVMIVVVVVLAGAEVEGPTMECLVLPCQ